LCSARYWHDGGARARQKRHPGAVDLLREAGDSRPLGCTTQQVDSPPIGQSSWNSADNSGHNRRVKAVTVEGDEEVRPRLDQIKHRINAGRVYLMRTNEYVGRAGKAKTALAHLDYALDVSHFARPANRAAQSEPLTSDVVSKVDASVDL
jgi:hypothetical protein